MALMCKVLHPMHWGKIGLKWVGLLTVTMVLVGTNARAGDGLVHFYDGLSCPTGARFDHQGAVVVLVAVGGDDRGEALVVEQDHHLLVRPAPLRGALGPSLLGQQRRAQAAHDPGLQHRRGSDDPGEPRRACRVLVHVDRVEIVHRLDPVADHRLVHRIGSDHLVARRLADEGLQPVLVGRPSPLFLVGGFRVLRLGPRRAHRAARFIPSPAMARISRWISLTPPPKVLIWACRPARSSRHPAS